MHMLKASLRCKVAGFALMLTRSRISDADADVQQVFFEFLDEAFPGYRPGFFQESFFIRFSLVYQVFFFDGFHGDRLLSVC